MMASTTHRSRLQIPTWPHYEDDEISAATQVLASGRVNYWTGDQNRAFEQEFAKYHRTCHAIGVSNGTVALELCLRGLGVGAGDEVIVPARTFVATAHAAAVLGARPVFADVDPASGNMDPRSVADLVSEATKAIVPVHTSGWPCEMNDILRTAEQNDLHVIEDCAQAHGARYRDEPVGSLGAAGAFSFCQDKIISTGGEGGMVITDDEGLWRRVWSFKDHGKSHDEVEREDHPVGFRWLHRTVGTNARMTEFQAAIGRIHLKKLEDFVERRRNNAAVLSAVLRRSGHFDVPEPPADVVHAFYRFDVRVRNDGEGGAARRDRLMTALAERGLPSHSGSCSEIYLEEAYRSRDWGPSDRLPVAKAWSETSLMFPINHRIPPDTMESLGEAIVEAAEAS